MCSEISPENVVALASTPRPGLSSPAQAMPMTLQPLRSSSSLRPPPDPSRPSVLSAPDLKHPSFALPSLQAVSSTLAEEDITTLMLLPRQDVFFAVHWASSAHRTPVIFAFLTVPPSMRHLLLSTMYNPEEQSLSSFIPPTFVALRIEVDRDEARSGTPSCAKILQRSNSHGPPST